MRRLLAILCLAAVNMLAAATQIRDTIYTGFSGVLFAGRMTIDAPAMTTADGRTVQRWQQTYTITAGVISVDLEPNSTATPAGTSYYVVYRPTSGLAWSERWVVTVSATSLKVSEVRVTTVPTPTVTFPLTQLSPVGAVKGDLIGFGTSWGTFTGGADGQALLKDSSQPRGLRWGTAATLSHGHPIADVTGLQTALDGKSETTHSHPGLYAAISHVHLIADVTGLQTVLTTVKQSRLYAADYCTVPGTFDHTCITAAIAAASANSVILLGKYAYSIGASISIASKTDLRIEGAGPSTVLTLANGVNAAVFAISGCTRCTIASVKIDGNKANQSVAADAVTISNSIGVTLENLSVTAAKGVCVSAVRSPPNSSIQDLFMFDGGSVEQCDGGGVKITAHVQYAIRKVLFSLNGVKQLHTSAGSRAIIDNNRFEFSAASTDNVVYFQTTTRPMFRNNYLRSIYATPESSSRENILFYNTAGGTLVGNFIESARGYIKLNSPYSGVFVVTGNGMDMASWNVTSGTGVATSTGSGLPGATITNRRHIFPVTCMGTTPIWQAFLPAGTSVTADCAEAANGIGGAGFPDAVGDQTLIFKVPLYPPVMTGVYILLYPEFYQTVPSVGLGSLWDGYIACVQYETVLNNLSWTKFPYTPDWFQQTGVAYLVGKIGPMYIPPETWVAAQCASPASPYALIKIIRRSNHQDDSNTATVYLHGLEVVYNSNQ